MKCKHSRHMAKVDVFTIEDTDEFKADIEIICTECGESYRVGKG